MYGLILALRKLRTRWRAYGACLRLRSYAHVRTVDPKNEQLKTSKTHKNRCLTRVRHPQLFYQKSNMDIIDPNILLRARFARAFNVTQKKTHEYNIQVTLYLISVITTYTEKVGFFFNHRKKHTNTNFKYTFLIK